MSEQLWTFGVEFEFLLGEAMPGTKRTDARVVHFPPTELTKEEHDHEVWAQKGDITFEAEPTWNNATAHILKTLTEAGIEVERDGSGGDFNAPDLTKWQLKSDSSLDIYPDSNPLYNKYAWYQIELVSPAFWNSSSSLQEVRKVLELLNSTYLVVSNASTGLHVHVGTGTKAGPSFELLKKAGAFFYAFEPQLTTLHPENRQGGGYAQTIRDTSRFSMKRQSRYIGPPSIWRGISHFLNAKKIENLVRDIGDSYNPKLMAYNHDGLRRRGFSVSSPNMDLPVRPTLEFRQHEGTLEPLRVLRWIQTCIGILDYCHRVAPKNFYSLLKLAVENEKWRLIGDGKDDEREQKFGPLLAESSLTVIDLLRHMGLHKPAAFYRNRYHKLKRAQNSVYRLFPKIDWDHQEPKNKLTGPMLLRAELARKSFESRKLVFRAESHAGRFKKSHFDAKSSVWPGHDKSLDDSADTDASSVYSDLGSEIPETEDEESTGENSDPEPTDEPEAEEETVPKKSAEEIKWEETDALIARQANLDKQIEFVMGEHIPSM